MDESGFEPIDSGSGADYGEPSISAGQIAREAAAAAVRGRPPVDTVRPGEQFRDTLESNESQTSQFQDTEQVADIVDEIIETAGEPVVETIITPEEAEALVAYGIEVPEVVPADFQDAYARLATSTLQVTREAEARVLEAQEQALHIAEQMKDMRARLSTPEGQKRLLLTLGLSAPELFREAQAVLDRVANDTEYAEVVRGRLEVEARMEAADRRERAVAAAQNQTRGRQIEDHTVRLAKRAGIDVDIAKEMVAARIIQNGQTTGKRDISIKEVDDIVGSLAKRLGNGRPVAKAPAAQKKVQQAPQKPVAGAGREAAAPQQQQQQSRGPAPVDAMDALRGAVRGAGQRLRAKGLG